MSDPQSEADKIRNKRLAKLGGGQPASTINGDASTAQDSPATPSGPSASIPTPPEPPTESSVPASTPSANPFSELGLKTESQELPRINITSTPSVPQKRDSDSDSRPRSRQGGRETPEVWEDRTLSAIFRITLVPEATKDAHGHRLQYLEGVRSDLEEEGAPVRLSTSILDQAILEAASNFPDGKPLDYLLACWKRVSRLYRSTKEVWKHDILKEVWKHDILKEARRLCMSYCIFAVTMPDMFGQEISPVNPLAKHLLSDAESDSGVCHDFLSEAVSRFPEDEGIKDALVGAMEQLSRDLSKMSMNDNFKPYVQALASFVRYPPLVDGLTKSSMFLPKDIPTQNVETDTLLGPFFRISPLQGEVALNYFAGRQTGNEGYIKNSQHALRMSLENHQDQLFDITNCIIKASKEPREKMLDWFAFTVNVNHKRRAMRVDPKTVSTDGFMVNVTVILDRLCEPFMDAKFSKIDRIDVDYLRRSPRIDIKDETKINADQSTSEQFYAEKAGGTNNFISEVFFLAVAAHHYGTEAANTKMSELSKDLKYLEKQVERFELERHKYTSNPQQLQLFENALKKYKDQIERGHCVLHATRGVLLDELTQARSMQFMRYVIVWLLRLASQSDYPKQPLQLPLPSEQPAVFKCLPEYFIEDIVDNFKFITRNMPHIITSTQCEELVEFCITFLRSSEYIKNPYLKSGLVTILFAGVWPTYNRPKGVLGDLLNGSEFAMKHLLHALMKFYIEAESTGTHTQFFDKFNIRYEIFQIIRCIWSNSVYRENLATEAKVNLEFFVRFVNLLLNDVTFVLDESFTAFTTIHRLESELEHPLPDVTPEARQEKEEALSAARDKAKSYMQLTNETVSMLKLFTEALAESFTMPEIVQRLADMLDYNLDTMVGPKSSNLKAKNLAEYNFQPRALLNDLVDVYINLKDKPNFHLAVARDGRSYSPALFQKAAALMAKHGLKSSEELKTWERLAAKIQAAKEADEQDEQDLGEPPDEFMDPLLYTLMEDPVILPTSKTRIDRSTIRSHLLSDPNDPFNRVPLKIEDIVPDEELKARIQGWKAERKAENKVKREAAGAAMQTESMDTS